MRGNNRLAMFYLVVLALLIGGIIMVEKYWDCRLKQHLSEGECFRREVIVGFPE
jgi:hypothetical protein